MNRAEREQDVTSRVSSVPLKMGKIEALQKLINSGKIDGALMTDAEESEPASYTHLRGVWLGAVGGQADVSFGPVLRGNEKREEAVWSPKQLINKGRLELRTVSVLAGISMPLSSGPHAEEEQTPVFIHFP